MSDQFDWEVDIPPEGVSSQGVTRAHRRKTDGQNYVRLHQRVTDCELSIKELEKDHAILKDKLESICTNISKVASILEAWNNAQGFWETLNFMAKCLKVLMVIGAFIASAWIFWKTGDWIKAWG